MSEAPPYRYPFFYGPEGRLIQVDAALEAVRRGSTTIGFKTKEYVLLASLVRQPKPLMEAPEKIFVVDDHVGATGSGYVGDLVQLVDEARVQAQRHRLVYDTPLDVLSLAKHLGAYFHSFTLYTVRPPGASMILGGADQLGLQLYQIEPGGTYSNGKAASVGQDSDKAMEILLQGYREDLSFEQGMQLAVKAITEPSGDKGRLEFGVVRKQQGVFEKISQEKISAIV
ncbi:MAG: proteasome subunit alpha [Thaumarchaeota archaeon]|nr:proteasome subunit alpha [Nitrososphaerota archaeon]